MCSVLSAEGIPPSALGLPGGCGLDGHSRAAFALRSYWPHMALFLSLGDLMLGRWWSFADVCESWCPIEKSRKKVFICLPKPPPQPRDKAVRLNSVMQNMKDSHKLPQTSCRGNALPPEGLSFPACCVFTCRGEGASTAPSGSFGPGVDMCILSPPLPRASFGPHSWFS